MCLIASMPLLAYLVTTLFSWRQLPHPSFRQIPHRPTVVQLKQPHHSFTKATPIKPHHGPHPLPWTSHLYANIVPNIILLACETKVDKKIKHTECLTINHTGHICLDRNNDGGGVVIFHRRDLVIDEVDLIKPSPADHHDEVVWAQLMVKGDSPMCIGSYYRSCSKTCGGGSKYKANSISGLESNQDFLPKTHIQKIPMLPSCWVGASMLRT